MNDPGNSSTVWILGAGFSQALNAPLFRDLFKSDHRVNRLMNKRAIETTSWS